MIMFIFYIFEYVMNIFEHKHIFFKKEKFLYCFKMYILK